jgi:hypothetical protein
MCDVEEVRLIEKTSRCAECKVGGEIGLAEEITMIELREGSRMQWNKAYGEVGQGRWEGSGI